MNAELAEQAEPPHWMAIGAVAVDELYLSAKNGVANQPVRNRFRMADVDVRVGSHELDNTHKIRDAGWFDDGNKAAVNLPLDDAEDGAIRKALWRATDSAYRQARKRLLKVKNNLAVKVETEDESGDFSDSPQSVHSGTSSALNIDVERWQGILRTASGRFLLSHSIEDNSVTLQAAQTTRTIVTTEGTRLKLPRTAIRIGVWARTTATDGMDISVYEAFDAHSAESLPSAETIESLVDAVRLRVEDLAHAPVVDPTVAPAILRGRSAAVFFHEVLGHRIEGHRQKDDDEGQTFTDKVGEAVLPAFISVIDDPTAQRMNGTDLNGHYTHDDEGVAAQRTVVVDRGILRDFLTSRSPIKATPQSNGHGRRQVGHAVVARQGNLMITASKTVPYRQLRRMLIAELKRQGKDYGFIVDDITGGFTFTGRVTPNAFAVQTVGVQRVWADGRPDELMRGADMIGTPLTTFNQIIAASDQVAVFNGSCGAESGWVPVSATAPDLLIREIEFQRSQKEHDRPPLLPPPGEAL